MKNTIPGYKPQIHTMKQRLLPLLLICFSLSGYLQAQYIVTGKIADQSGTTIPGATVMVEGTTRGTVSNLDGEYSIDLESDSAILVYSYLGYFTQVIPVEGRTVIDIVLEEDIQRLDEVVVIGYGSVKRRDLTGAVTSVKGEELSQSGFASVDQALLGRVAGLVVETADNSAGAAASIRIRGANSISGSSEPLYVIDGIPILNNASQRTGEPATLSPLAGLSPNDIESINILKDASATAIYGAQGANGVIIITTRQGQQGKLNISFNSSYGVQTVDPNVYKMLDSYGFAKFRNQHHFPYPMNHLTDSIDLIGNVDAKWFDGATEDIAYNVGIGYAKNVGVVENSDADRTSIKFGLRTTSSKKLQFGINALTSFYNSNGIVTSNGPNQGVGDATAGILLQALRYRPMTPLKDENGEYIETDIEGGGALNNPYLTVTEVDMSFKNNYFNANTYLQYNFTNHLNLRASLGGNISNSRFLQWIPTTTAWGRTVNGFSYTRNTNNRKIVTDILLNYSNTFGESHRIDAMGGYTANKSDYFNINTYVQNYDIQSLGINNIGLGAAASTPQSHANAWALQSYLGRAFYSFQDKYSITASLRADGTSRVSPDNAWGLFPSAAVSWRITEESFMQSVDWLAQLKLRVSYGVTGNQNIPPYQFYSSYSAQQTVIDNQLVPSSSISQLQNNDLKWETTDQFNVGLDFGMFAHRVSGAVDVYKKITNDLLMQTIIPATSGLSVMYRNVGSLENKGLEFTLNTVNIDNGSFKFTSNFNIAFNRNKVTDLGDKDTIPVAGSSGYNQVVLIKGMPIGLWFGWQTDGIWQMEDFTYSFRHPDGPLGDDGRPLRKGWHLNKLPDGTYPASRPNDSPGRQKFVDQNKDGVINDEDRVVVGISQPDFTGSFSSALFFKGFDLNFMLDFRYGKEVFHATRWWLQQPNTVFQNKLEDDYWRFTEYEIIFDDQGDPVELGTTVMNDENGNPLTGNPTNEKIRLGQGDAYLNLNDAFIEDGSYLRLRTISLGYTLPIALTGKIGINRLRFYVTGINLLTMTKYTGYDPAVNSSSLNGLRPGYDYSAHPLPKTIMFGLNLDL
jgi:TonB-linked SusC/RagA family outer membrane protein